MQNENIKILNSWPHNVDPNILYVVKPLYLNSEKDSICKQYICLHKNLIHFFGHDNKDYEIIGKIHCYHLFDDNTKRNIEFSVGDDVSYYQKIKQFSNYKDILYELNDLIYNTNKLVEFQNKKWVNFGVLVDKVKFEKCLKYILGNEKNRYIFYSLENDDINLEFNCSNNGIFMNNIHAFVGRNGVGKTYLMNNMILSLISRQSIKRGSFAFNEFKPNKIINVLLNPIDNEIIKKSDVKKKINYSIIRDDYFIKDIDSIDDRKNFEEESNLEDSEIKETYTSNSNAIKTYETIINFKKRKKDLLYEIIKQFNSDYCFNESNIIKTLIKPSMFSYLDSFYKLSRGHKKIIISLVAIINEIEDNSLIFFDEPEANLYPGLLTLYLKGLKLILNEFKSIMFVFTHSPVIVQQLTKDCIWKIERNKYYYGIRNISFSTLGENIGKVTRDIFDIEIENSLYYEYASKMKNEKINADEIFGDEAQALMFEMEKK